MADIINLASFDFDSTRLEKTLEELQKRMYELQKAQKATREEMKENEKQYAAGAMTADELNKANQKLFDTQKDLQRQQAVVNKEYQTAAKLQQQLIDTEGKRITATQALNDALNREVKTIADARKNNKELLAIRNEIDTSTEEGRKQIELINEALNKNNQFIKENVSAYEQQKINIGNYKGAIIEAYQELNIFNGGLTGFAQRAQAAGGAGALVTSSLKSAATAMAGFTKAMLAFLATPIGAILAVIAGAFMLIKNALNRTEESADKFKAAIAPIAGLFKGIMKILEPVGKFLIDGLVAGFEKATSAIQKTISLVGSGLKAIGFESAGDAVLNFANNMAEAANQAKELALMEQRITESNRALTVSAAQTNKETQKLKETMNDTTKSLQERIEASEEYAKKMDAQRTRELEHAKLVQKRIETEIALNGANTELLDQQAEIKAKILEIESVASVEIENQKFIQNLRKEAHDKYMQQLDAQIQKQKEQLDLWIAEQGDRARTLQQQLDLDQQVADKRKEILKAELKAKKISEEKYQTEIIQLDLDLAKKRAEIAVESAQRQLEEFIKENQSRLKQGELLTDEMLSQEIAREQAIREQSEAFELERYSQGLINETEYQDNLLAIKSEYLEKEAELNKTFSEQQKAQRDLTQALEFEQRLLELEDNAWTEFERRQIILDQQAELEKQKLDEQLANNLISQENYNLALQNLEEQTAQASAEIEAQRQQYKMSVASQTFGNLATIAGKESAAGKAFAIAQTTIDTYQSAVAAFKALAGIPVYGPVLGGIASAAAIASGLQTVKKIASTPTPSAPKVSGTPTVQAPRIQGFAGGGEVKNGIPISRSNGDNVLITAKKGEVILNQEQRDFIGSQLLSFAGVPGFATGGLVGALPSNQQSIQSIITQGFDAEIISEAVKEGAKEGAREGSYDGSSKGSQEGIADLSTNRQIQNNATF